MKRTLIQRRAVNVCLAVALPIGLTSSVFGQAWLELTPKPTAQNLNGVAMLSSTHMFVVGSTQGVYETPDGGATWTQRTLRSFGTDPYYAVAFPDSQHGYVFGNNNDAWRTTNGGVSWTQMMTFPAGSARIADFLSPTSGFVGLNGAMIFTGDGGVTWQVRSGYPSCPIVYGMDFRSEQVGLVAGNQLSPDYSHGVYRTTNGGETWSLRLEGLFNDVLFLSNGDVLAARNEGSVFRSFDDGLSWTQIAFGDPNQPGILDFTAIDLSTIVAVSAGGDVLRSADGGYSWSLVFEGIGDLPGDWSVSFLDGQHGSVVGVHGIILGSDDAGQTWRIINNGVGMEVTDIKMFDDSFGITTGQNGYVQRTIDGGVTWQVQKLEVTGQIFGRDESLDAVSIVDRDFAVAAGPGGTVFRTLDGGQTWESIGYPNLSGVFWISDVEMIDRNVGWLVGTDLDLGHRHPAYSTNDGGLTWTPAFDLPAEFRAVHFIDAQHGWIATSDEAFYRTDDGGASWQLVILPAGPYGTSISTVEFADASTGWVVGWFGYIAHTTDGGHMWELQAVDDPEMNFIGLSVVSPNEAWSVGRNGAYQVMLYHTINGGATWTHEFINDWPDSLSDVRAQTSGQVWLAGADGRILTNREPGGLPGDVDGDGDVDLSDLTLLLSAFGACSGDAAYSASADFDSSGCVELGDLATLLANFGR